MARQGVIAVQHSPHAVCKLVASIQPATTRDPVGKCLRQERRNAVSVRRTTTAVKPFTELLRALLPVPLIT